MITEEQIRKAAETFETLLREQLARRERLLAKEPEVDFAEKRQIIIGLIDGDGIGPIIMKEAARVLTELLKDEILTVEAELEALIETIPEGTVIGSAVESSLRTLLQRAQSLELSIFYFFTHLVFLIQKKRKFCQKNIKASVELSNLVLVVGSDRDIKVARFSKLHVVF